MYAKGFPSVLAPRHPHMEGRLVAARKCLAIVRLFLVLFAILNSSHATKQGQQQILLWVCAALSHMTGSNLERAN
ncbi:hypothetical protein C1A23_25390 [Aeromonas hydrophila subsp. hydrophila]|nr:hypothetical protein C1A23_25390 [Aeromonas hydrophila subsp. hydrophila]